MDENKDRDAPNPNGLDEVQQARWDAFKDSTSELADAAASGDAEGFGAAWAEMGQVAKGLDAQAYLNATHLPKDAGEWADGLAAILTRIPDGWGRWISCGPGWYPLIVELDRALAELFPGYTVEQVKEKYGSLRYYFDTGAGFEKPGDPEPKFPDWRDAKAQVDKLEAAWSEYKQEHPEDFTKGLTWASLVLDVPGAAAVYAAGMDNEDEAVRETVVKEVAKEMRDAWNKEHKAWSTRFERYLKTKEGKARQAEAEERYKKAEELVAEAEKCSYTICENCGEPGEMRVALCPSPWYKTLCANCGNDLVTMPEWKAWWEIEKPIYLVERKKELRERYSKKKILFACSDRALEMAIPVTYARTKPEARHLLKEDKQWDEIWFDDLSAGQEVVKILSDRYAEVARVEKEKQGEKNYFHLAGTPNTCEIGPHVDCMPLLKVGITVHGGTFIDELCADPAIYDGFRKKQWKREQARRKAKEK